MKKLLLALALTSAAMTTFAQEDAAPTKKHSVATNSFFSNWFVQFGADWNAWYSDQEHGFGLSHSPFKGFRSNPGASFAIGKWFTPGIGLRTKVQGIWGKTVLNDNPLAPRTDNGNKYWLAQEQVLLNLSNLFYGYNEQRVWNLIPFFGVGIGRSMTHNEYATGFSVGIQSSWKLTKKLDAFVECGWNRYENDIDGVQALVKRHRGWDSHDNNLYAEVGVTFKLGKSTWDKVPDMDVVNAQHQADLDALNAQLKDYQEENERLRAAAEAQPDTAVEAQALAGTPISVFFDLDKTTIASRKDLVNVEALAKYAIDNNCGLLVTGYADGATGNAVHNQQLSEARAAALVDELVRLGVSRDKITTVGKGGVGLLSPDNYNRRATVELSK